MDVVIDELNDMLNLKMREKIKNYHLIFFSLLVMNDWPSARTPINMNRDLREGSLSRERPPERERREGAPRCA